MHSTTNGATVAHLNMSDVRELPLPSLPHVEEQRRIAAVLSAYDDLVENCERRIRVLDEMTRALYREWFVHFRYPGHEQVPLVDSPLGRIPKGWEVARLETLATLNYGKALKADARQGGDVPVFASSGIVGWHDQRLTPGPGIILGRKGNVGSLFWSDRDFYVIDTAYYVTSEYPLLYIYHSLHGLNFINNDSAVPGLSRQQAYAIDVCVPPRPLAEKFSEVAGSMLSQRQALTRQAQNLRATRDLLLPRLLSGQLTP